MGLNFFKLLEGDQATKTDVGAPDPADREDQWVGILKSFGALAEDRDVGAGFAAGMLVATKSNRIRDAAALALADLGAKDAVGSLIEVLRRPETANQTGTLLFALNELGASLPLGLLVDLIERGSYEGRAMTLWFVEDGRIGIGDAAALAIAKCKLVALAERTEDPEGAEEAEIALDHLSMIDARRPRSKAGCPAACNEAEPGFDRKLRSAVRPGCTYLVGTGGSPMTLTQLSPDAARRQAIAARDAAADGTFVYAVRTTGVYCRPSCPSRAARPENVLFFDSGVAAAAAGFRPCRRCRPDAAPPAERDAAIVTAACRQIETAEETPTLDALAARACLSPFHFHRLFKARTGLTPKSYAAAHRARRVAAALGEAGSVTDAIYAAGYASSGRFYATSNEVLGMTPSAYRHGGADAVIRFAVGQCALGAVLVARSDKGVCAILIGDDPDALARDLQDRFPRAELIGDDAGFEALVATVVGLVEHPARGADLPLDVRGTAFQQRVWQALRAIPPGTTATYTEIARRIGAPAAMRAVAGACAANPIAVAIPCHRVVRSDGGLSGYRWGVERKRALLASEGGGQHP